MLGGGSLSHSIKLAPSDQHKTKNLFVGDRAEAKLQLVYCFKANKQGNSKSRSFYRNKRQFLTKPLKIIHVKTNMLRIT